MPHTRTGPRAVAALAAAALALPATASAHVTLQPPTAPADGFTRLDVRVPNERDDAGTVKVAVQLPPGFAFVSYEPRPGWKVTVEREKVDQPIEVEGGSEVDEQVSRITWSGGRIGPGEFVDFGLSLRMPKGEAGEKLTFKALQTYEGGEVVRWIGPEDADEPAPIVTLTGAGGGSHGAPGTAGDTPVSSDDAAGAREPAGAPAENASVAVEDDGGSDGVAIAALAVAVLALIAGLGAFGATRRTRARVTLPAPEQE